ncbi:hypothetical protein DCC62_31695, partial [candidate division KSB1 bacterium]
HRVSVREARDIIDNAAGLAARYGTRVIDVFERPEVKKIFLHDNWTPRQRTHQLRTLLYRERYPQLSSLEERFDELAKTLAGGKRLDIRPPKDFEGDDLTISFRANTSEEVTTILKTMNEAERRGLWEKLFALLQGENKVEDDF